MKRSAQFIGSWALAILIMRLWSRSINFASTVDLIRNASPALMTAGAGLIIAAYLVRAARWQVWQRHLSYRESLQLILVGFMGNNVLTARRGEMMRARYAAARGTRGPSPAAAIASIAAERMLDGLVLGIFGLAAAMFVRLTPGLAWPLFGVSTLFAGLGIAVGVGIFSNQRVRSLVGATNRRFPGHVTAYGQEKANEFLNGMEPMRNIRRMAGALSLTAAVWILEAASCSFFGRAVWPAMDIPRSLLFLAVVNFASLIPLTMGGLGTIEGATPLFLIGAGVAGPAALAMTVLQHGAQYLFTTASGAILFLACRFYRIAAPSPPGSAVPTRESQEPSFVIEETRSQLGELGSSVELRPAKSGTIDLSIVIPAYNEEARLPRTVLSAMQWCTSRGRSFELVIADDGSHDATLALGRLFEESDTRIRSIACPHMGKGAAVRMGVLNARGRFVLFMDADGATPLNEIPKLVEALEQGHDVAIGSRVVQHPGEVEVKTPIHRRIIGRVFALLVNLFAIEGIADTQCGFKMFRCEAAAAIFSRQKISGFAFDVEILFLALRLNLSIAEIPVNWTAQPGSKVNLVTDSIKMLWDISHIRWLHRSFARTNRAPTQHIGRDSDASVSVGSAR